MPETTVAAIITSTQEDTTRVLLTRRNIAPFKGQWCLPGGHIDHDREGERRSVAGVAERLEDVTVGEEVGDVVATIFINLWSGTHGELSRRWFGIIPKS